MKTIRKGSDIVVRWRIFRYGQKYDIALYRESISLVLSNMGEKKEITDYSIVDVNTIVFKYRAEDQGLGIYRLLLIDKSRNSTRIIEECNAFRLVNTSDAANNDGTLESAITITLTSELTAPADGLSAYEVALQNGFIGTEEEWLQSLKGEQGPQGIQGDKGVKGDRGEQGDKGLSAYQVAIANGFVGTEEEWLQSLVPDTTDIELAEAQRQAKELERIEAENTRQSAELERQNASTGAVSSANEAATNANNAATTAQQKAEEANTAASAANAAASSANAVVGEFNSIIVQETGNSQDKVMSQKAVTDAMTASQAKLSELEQEVIGPQVIDVTGTGTFQVGRVFTVGIDTSYTNYRYMLFDAKKGDIIHYKTMADSNTLVFGLQNSDGITFTKIQKGTGTSNYVEGDYPVSEDSGFVICGLNNVQVLATITRDSRILLLETEVAEINEEIPGVRNSIKNIEIGIGFYKVDENLIGVCSVITNKYINYNGGLNSLAKYNTYLLAIENATQIKVKGGFEPNTAIAFYSSKDLNATNLVEIHKYSDYTQDSGYYTDEITLSVPSGAKYFAFPVWDTYNTSAYVKASQVAEQTESINTRISTLEEGASAFFIDPTLHLEGITDNPLALIKKNGGLASAFESWGFIGDSLASGEIWGWLNEQKVIVGAKTNKMVDATGNIVDATGYIISEPLREQTYRPKFVVEFANNMGLSSSMCIVARCDASGNILAVGAVGGTATKYTFSVSDNQYVVVCYPSENVPSVRCVSNYVWDNYDISWGQYMCRICGSTGVNYSTGGGTAKKFVLGQSPFSSANSLAKLKSDSQKQGYIIAFGVNDRGNAIYDGNVTDINNIGADVNLADPTQNANTFAGYYARVIQEIKNTFQDSFIFLVTIPESSGYDEMNTIIRAMPGIFEGTYNSIYLLDLKKFLPESAISQFRMNGFHLNAQGYAYFAYTFCTYIDWLIRTYPNEFKGISLVGKALLVNPS